MRVGCISLHAAESGFGNLAARAATVKVKGIRVSPHASWYADLVLEAVSGLEFGAIEDATRRFGFFCLRPGDDGYAPRHEVAYVQFHNHDLVQRYVQRGALTNHRMAAELAKQLEALIERMMKSKK